MRGVRIFALLVLLGLGTAAAWFWNVRQMEQGQGAGGGEAPQAAYDYEAHQVVMRQMDPNGRLTFQVEARQITQLPDSGRVTALGLTLYHDPPGTAVGGPNRWTLTADRGELPAEGGVVMLSGHVRAHGIPVEGRSALTITTQSLRYDMATQELSSDEVVQFSRGSNGIQGEGRGLRANIRTGRLELEEGNATFTP
jgi:LPS export ABC transporter protein LptC